MRYLFSQHILSDVLEWKKKSLVSNIENLDGEVVLTRSIEDWCNYFEEKYKIKIPVLIDDQIEIDEPKEIIIEEIRGTSITYHIPFKGDQEAFDWFRPYKRPEEPTQVEIDPPPGVIVGNEILLTYQFIKQDPDSLASKFSRQLSDIKEILRRFELEVSEFNEFISEITKSILSYRQKKLFADKKLVDSLSYPIRRRNNAPETYKIPTIRLKTQSIPKKSSKKQGQTIPEPMPLDMEEYEHILLIIHNMVRVMELSPKTFINLKEEDIRNHFLVQLNGQYKGTATGETFNFEGKTDILVKVEGKNAFIAECMFWDGPESLKKKIDQLLGYTSWRDTKIAILIFNRKKDFTKVLEKISPTIKEHKNFKREISYDSETGYRFIFHHRDDTNREFTLTVLAFEIPS